jgi:hypothetical protein
MVTKFSPNISNLPDPFQQALGVGLTALRQGAVLGTTALRRRLLVSLEINNKDKSYEWFLAWMAHQAGEPSKGNVALRSAPWVRSHQLSVETTVEQRKNGSSSAAFKLVAGPGNHYINYKGAWMQVYSLFIFPVRVYLFRLAGETRARNAIDATHVGSPLGDRDIDHPFS